MRKLVTICVALAFALFGPSQADAFKGDVTISLAQEVPTMDPHIATSTVGVMVWRWVFDTLTSAEPGTGKIRPWLAEKWEKIDPTKIKFWLRKGQKFSDGTPVTAHAVKYAMDRMFDPENKSTQAIYFKNFDRIEIIDDHTFIWHSKSSDNGLLNRLAHQVAAMSLGTKGWDKSKLARNPVGSGPYLLKSWTKGLEMVFEANPDWWGNSRYPDRPKTVTLRPIRELATGVNAVIAGEVDVIKGVMPELIPKLESAPNVKVAEVPSVRIMYLGFFTKHGGPFTDPKVRLAVNYAIDAEQLRKTLIGGRADLYGQIYHPWTYSGHRPGRTWYGHDLEKARALMRESSYPDGFKAEIIASVGNFPADKATCEAAVGMLKELKIEMKCTAESFPLFVQSFQAYRMGKKKGAGMFLMGFANNPGDTALVLRAVLSCNGFFSGSCYKDLDEAIDKAASIYEPEEQQVAYEKVTDMIKEKAALRILYKLHDVFALSKRLDYRPRHDEMVYPWEIRVK